MLSKIRTTLLATLFLFSILSAPILSTPTSAKPIDPCWYGCPKDGCPKCDTGGKPIGRSSSQSTFTAASAFNFTSCRLLHESRVADCDSYFPGVKDLEKHKECIAKDALLYNGCSGVTPAPVIVKKRMKLPIAKRVSPASFVPASITPARGGTVPTTSGVDVICPCLKHCPLPGGATTCCEYEDC